MFSSKSRNEWPKNPSQLNSKFQFCRFASIEINFVRKIFIEIKGRHLSKKSNN